MSDKEFFTKPSVNGKPNFRQELGRLKEAVSELEEGIQKQLEVEPIESCLLCKSTEIEWDFKPISLENYQLTRFHRCKICDVI